jgi:S1-C subfamily serine protease
MNIRLFGTFAALGLMVASVRAAETTDPDQASRAEIERKLEQAKERLEQSAREIGELSVKLNGNLWTGFGAPPALLGINVGPQKSVTADPAGGVRVLSVSPGGPADAAGLKANDVIVSFGGHALKGDESHSPPQQLIGLLRTTKPDAAIAVELQRDGKPMKIQIVPQGPEAFNSLTRRFAGFGDRWQGFDSFKGFGDVFGRSDLSAFGSAEFLELSAALGRYFGTDKGLLVVRAPKDERLKLEDGDVILDIDGRIPRNGSHALQILSSYRAGETLKVHIMRLQKKTELLIKVPEDLTRSALSFRFRRHG